MTLPPAIPPTGAGGHPAFPPARRTRSTSQSRSRAQYELAGQSGTSALDLPSSTAMADLELTRSHSRSSVGPSGDPPQRREYRGGGGLVLSQSRATGRRTDPGRRGLDIEEGREDEGMESTTGVEKDEEESDGPPGETDAERLERMYARFSKRQKSTILAIVSYSALLAPFASSCFLPSIPVISRELNTDATILNITVAVYIAIIGISPLIWAPYSGAYGRRPIYLLSLPIFALGSLGVALCTDLGSLIVTRVIQGFGSSAVLSVGSGSIGDIFARNERGTAMGLYYSGILIGPAVAPAIAGVLTEYVPNEYGWRAMQWLLFGMGVVASLLSLLCFPETIHEKGIVAIKRERRREREERGEVEFDKEGKGKLATWWGESTFLWLNPLAPLRLLMLPHIAAMAINSSFVLLSTYSILVPLSQTIAPRYNITNSAVLGCFYIAQGGGNAFASLFTGRYADYTLKKWLHKRGGVYVPEDRLRATLIGGGAILPSAVLALGWVMERADGSVGLAFCVILLVIDGIGLMAVLTATNTYLVDTLQHRSAEVICVNNMVRYVISAAASAYVLPMIQAIGVGWANTFTAFLCWIAFGIVVFTIRHGAKMRELGAKWEGTESAGKDEETVVATPTEEEKKDGLGKEADAKV